MVIYKNNVYSFLSSDTPDNIVYKIDKQLTVPHPNFWFSPKYKQGLWDGTTHFLKLSSLKFPTGLLFIVEETLNKIGESYEIIDRRKKPKTHALTGNKVDGSLLEGITLYEYQKTAVEMAIKAERGVIELPTGSGKTEIAGAIIKLLNLKTLFIVNKKDLLHQTRQRFMTRLGRDDIGIIGDSQHDSSGLVVVATVQSLNRISNAAKLRKFLNPFQVLFYDECHHSSAPSWWKIGMFAHSAFYRFGMSGTALRRDILSNMKIMAITGSSIYNLSSLELIEKGHLSKIKIHMIENPEIIAGNDWKEIYNQGIVESISRNVKIAIITEEAFKRKNRVLILVRRIKHGKILKDILNEEYDIPAEFLWGSHDGQIRQEIKERFDKKGDFVLIASDIFAEGVDIPNMNVLVIASGGKSEWEVIQKVGRGLRKKGVNNTLRVYDFIDNSKFLRNHSRERIRVYRQEGWLN